MHLSQHRYVPLLETLLFQSKRQTNSTPPNKLDSDLKHKSHLCHRVFLAGYVGYKSQPRVGEPRGAGGAAVGGGAERGGTYGWHSLIRSWSVVPGGRPRMYRLVLLSCSPPLLLLLFVLGLGGAMGWGAGA